MNTSILHGLVRHLRVSRLLKIALFATAVGAASSAFAYTPPVLTSSTTASGTVGSAFSYTATFNNGGEPGSPSSYGMQGTAPPGTTFNTTTHVLSGTITGSGGTYTPQFGASNVMGLTWYTVTITVPNPTPTASFSSQPAATVYPGATLAWSGSGVCAGGIQAVHFDWVQGGSGGEAYVAATSGQIVNANGVSAGSVGSVYQLKISAESSGGTWSSQVNGSTTTVVAQPVTFSSMTPTSFTYTGGSQGPTSATFSPGVGSSYTITGQQTNAGTYTATATANGNYTGSGTTGYTINKASQSVSVSASATTVAQGTTVNFTASGAGVGGYTWGGGPTGTASTSSYLFSTPGSYTVSVYSPGDANHNASNTATIGITVTDTQPPTAPTGLASSSVTATSFTLGWNASTDNVGVAGYHVYNNGVEVSGSPLSGRSISITGLTEGTSYPMTVKAYDAAENLSTAGSLSVQTTDTQAPTAPTGLVASSVTATSFTLGWTASTDNVGVVGYHVYNNGTEVSGSPVTSGTSLAISGLTEGTSYPMTVKAYDAAGNLSTAGSLSVLTTDTQAPTAPTSLTASSVTATSFTLGWTASTDNVGVVGYHVYNNGTEVSGSPVTSGTSLAISGLTEGTSYPMTVKAYDAAGNISTAGSLSVLTTDTQAPTAPTGLSAASVTATSFTLSWTASTDNVGVVGYHVYNNGTEVSGSPVTSGTSLAITGLTEGTLYPMTVKAYDAAGNLSTAGSLNVLTTDTQAPTAPTALTSSSIGAYGFTLTWTASTDNVGVVGYHVYANGTEVAGSPVTSGTTLAVTGLSLGTNYTFTAKAYDAAGNVSAASAPLNVMTSSDGTPPSVPTGLVSSNVSYTSFTLTWTASSDNIAVASYRVYQNGTLVSTVSSPTVTLNLTGLQPNTTYAMTVEAGDTSYNWSAASSALNVTTLADTTAPTVPTGLASSNVSYSSFTLSWTASTDNVGVAGYHVYNNGVEVAGSPLTATTISLSGLALNTTYPMTVKAFDAAGNVSAASSVLNVTTLADTTAPSVPTGLASSLVTSTSFLLSWTPSTDNVGVTAYRVYKAGTLLTTVSSPTTSFSVSGLTPNVGYSMTVSAGDAAGNWSAQSSALVVTTTVTATTDTDSDGTPDVIEAQLGTNPNVASQSDTSNQTQLKINKP